MKEDIMTDQQAIMLAQEQDEVAKDYLFNKYKYIIDILLKKYDKVISSFQLDKKEIYSECLYGFSDALNSYNPDKEASLPTFITLCVKRRIITSINKANTNQQRFNNSSYSIDYVYDEYGFSLIDILSDNNKNDPLYNLTKQEETEELYQNIKNVLSDFEKQVFKYMLQGLTYTDIAEILKKEPKQIDNTIQRIKNKVKSIILMKENT